MPTNVWLEVALNGSWTRRRQPNIPVAADEIVRDALACADAGASIVHFHAYDPDTGRQRDAYELYAPVIERIRSQRDLVVYPTIPYARLAELDDPASAAARFAPVERLAEAGLIEWAAVDPGSVHIAQFRDLSQGREGFLYLNPEAHVRHGLQICERYRLTPSYAVYEPGFARLGAALHRAAPRSPRPVYRLMLSEHMAFGFPPEEYALDAYLNLLACEATGAAWMVAGLGVDITPLIPMTVREGGHVRVGLEDAALGSPQTNVDLVREAATAIERAGGRLSSAQDVRGAQAHP